MKTLEVFYHNQEQLDFIHDCLKKGPPQEETIAFITKQHLTNYGPFINNSSAPEFWDVGKHLQQDTENKIISAMNCFTFITVRQHKEKL